MTQIQFTRLQKICNVITTNSNLGVMFDYQTIKTTWRNAIYYNRLQNDFIKDGYKFDTVRVFNFPSQTGSRELRVQAVKSYSRLEWFKLLVCQSMFIDFDQLKTIIK